MPLSSPSATAVASPATRPARVMPWVSLARRAYWPAVLGLIALNGWWVWDARPIPDLKYVDRWIAQERDLDARSASWWNFWHVPQNNDSAISVLQRAIHDSPNDGHARMLLGRAFGAKKDYRNAAEQWRSVPFWSPYKPEALYGEALGWLELNRLKDAEIALLAYLDADPNHPSARPQRRVVEDKLLDIYGLEDRWEEARAIVWKSYDDASGSVARRSRLEMSLKTRLERSHPSAALVMLRQAVAADPNDWEARRALARAANAEKSIEEADREINVCLAARPKDPKVWGEWLDMLRVREDFDGLVTVAAKSPPEADADPRVLLTKGRIRLQDKDYAGASQAFAKVVEISPADPAARNSLSLTLRLIGRPGEAGVHLARHAELDELTKEVPAAVNAFKDASEAVPVKPDELKAAMIRLSKACRGMGWTRDADGWVKAAAEL